MPLCTVQWRIIQCICYGLCHLWCYSLTWTLVQRTSNWIHWATLRWHSCLLRAAISQLSLVLDKFLLIMLLQFVDLVLCSHFNLCLLSFLSTTVLFLRSEIGLAMLWIILNTVAANTLWVWHFHLYLQLPQLASWNRWYWNQFWQVEDKCAICCSVP